MEVAMAQQENAAAINIGSAQIGAMGEPEHAIGGNINFDAAQQYQDQPIIIDQSPFR